MKQIRGQICHDPEYVPKHDWSLAGTRLAHRTRRGNLQAAQRRQQPLVQLRTCHSIADSRIRRRIDLWVLQPSHIAQLLRDPVQPPMRCYTA